MSRENETPQTLEICRDCVMLLANGEVHEWRGRDYVDTSDEIAAKIHAIWGDTEITLGHLCEITDCGADSREEHGEEEPEPWFSKSDCDGCGQPLAGDREYATAWIKNEEK